MKIKLGATIPVVSFGNLQPEFEVESDDPTEAMASLEAHIQSLWDKYGEKPLKQQSNRKLIEAFAGGSVYYDEATHTYTNEAGEKYISGSEYAKSSEKPFDLERISEALAKKTGQPVEDIKAMWELKSQVSRGFGTAIHAAIELHGRFQSLSERLENTTSMHDHPVLKTAVEGFYKGRENEVAEYEAVVVDHATKRAGRIDRILIDGDNVVVQDIKTDAVLKPEKIEIYWKQLTFYGDILKAAGWNVTGYELLHWDGKWNVIRKEEQDANT